MILDLPTAGQKLWHACAKLRAPEDTPIEPADMNAD